MDYKLVIKRKKIKNLKFKVEEGTVIVTAPIRLSKTYIYNVLEKNEVLINKMLLRDKNILYRNNLEDSLVYLFGKKLDKILVEDLKNEKDIEELYRKELYKILPGIFKKYNEKTKLYEKEFNIRKMKVRWGTCYPKRKVINLNLFLAKRPIDEIESVVLHELIHLKIGNHSKEFYSEVKKYMPNYDDIKDRLNS
ncbi:MAG: M48 family metallopeptidase [Peptoniphilaceae bacterium]